MTCASRALPPIPLRNIPVIVITSVSVVLLHVRERTAAVVGAA